jgi:homoserine O-succinyltransferase/O-acetyltransferase
MSPSARPAPLRLGLIDMNNGVPNQAIRSFRTIVQRFFDRVRACNPGLPAELLHVQPRNLGEAPPPGCDLYLCSGGPDSPVDGFSEPWATPFRAFLDGLLEGQRKSGPASPSALVVCYSFELATLHFGVAKIVPRQRKFGIMPVYPTAEGMGSDLLGPFGDRLFVWEHRSWQAVDLDARRLAELGGALLARESRDGHSKGRGLMAFRFAPGVEGAIFHPEADRPGALNWLERPEQAEAVTETYGELVYQRMLRTLDDPTRLARTYALMIPGWLTRSFNALAPARGWVPLEAPRYDAAAGLESFKLRDAATAARL